MSRMRFAFACVLVLAALAVPGVTSAQQSLDFDVSGGHFYKQANGQGGQGDSGYSVTNEAGVPFWDAYQRYGGPSVLGYPVTRRFVYDGFVTQAMQKAVFQWRADQGQVAFLNTFDALHDKGKDDWLEAYRQTPKPFDTSADANLSWEQVVSRHLGFLDQNGAIKQAFLSDPSWLDHFGLPVSYADMGNSFVIRAQRATFQFWKEDVPWAKAGTVSIANGGDLAKEAGLWPDTATFTDLVPFAMSTASVPAGGTSGHKAASPEYSMNAFIWGYPATTARDLGELNAIRFNWQKSLFQWRAIERDGKGQFDWSEADRVVKATNAAGIKIIARLDFQPGWARADGANNGPPDNYADYRDFVYALIARYRSGSPFGHIDAVELWNEPNLAREWGGQKPDAGQYVQLLRAGYEGAKKADPTVTVVSAGLTPTGTYSNDATPDDIFLQQMYDAGASQYFDVLGAHGAGYKAPPEMSPDQIAADPSFGGQRFFGFRRVEDLRAIMVKNGDSARQIWITEFGWTSDPVHPAYAWHAVTEDQKAQYIVRAFQWARSNWAPWMGVMSLWNLPDPTWGPDREEYWWSIANPDGSPRPAYSQLLQARQNGTLP